MAQNLVALNAGKLVTMPVTAARPVAAGDGVDITNWRVTGLFGPPLASVMLGGTLAANVSSPTGGANGVEVWGYVQTAWWLIGYLNNGADVPLAGAGQGFAQEMDVIGIFERLAIAGTPSAGVVTATLVPMASFS